MASGTCRVARPLTFANSLATGRHARKQFWVAYRPTMSPAVSRVEECRTGAIRKWLLGDCRRVLIEKVDRFGETLVTGKVREAHPGGDDVCLRSVLKESPHNIEALGEAAKPEEHRGLLLIVYFRSQVQAIFPAQRMEERSRAVDVA